MRCFMKEIYIEEMAQYLADKGGCSLEAALAYCDAEEEYYDEQGLNIYDFSERPREFGPYIGAPVIENDDMVKYISKKTGLGFELVENLSMIELEYLELPDEE